MLKMSFCSTSGSEKYRDHFDAGIYQCAKCGHELFNAKSKYAHETPWPAFTQTIARDSVTKEKETEPQESSDAEAFKLFCGKCHAAVGHEFIKDGPDGKSRF